MYCFTPLDILNADFTANKNIQISKNLVIT